MKKAIIIVATVMAMIGATVYADRATRGSVPKKTMADVGGGVEGKPAPEITLKDLNGKDVSLAELKGKVVFVNFWATWCEPCRVEIPWLIGFQQKYADKGLTILGVAMDDEGKSVAATYVKSTQFDVDGHSMTMNYPIVLGNDDIAAKFGGLLGFPTTIVISRDGKVQKRFIGLADEADLEKQIKALL